MLQGGLTRAVVATQSCAPEAVRTKRLTEDLLLREHGLLGANTLLLLNVGTANAAILGFYCGHLLALVHIHARLILNRRCSRLFLLLLEQLQGVERVRLRLGCARSQHRCGRLIRVRHVLR